MNISDRIVATIRTGVPALIGYLLAQLIAVVPAVADVIAFLDAQLTQITLGVPIVFILQSAAVAGVIALYYYLARLIGSKFPFVERFLLGSSLVPIYVAPAVVDVEDDVTRREYRNSIETGE